MTALFDVNVIIARLDPKHQFHQRVMRWMIAQADLKLASCSIIELGVLRIYGHHSYPAGPGSPAEAAMELSVIRTLAGHVYVSDLPSPLDDSLLQSLSGCTPKHLTDLYLLALAVRHKARFVTLDEKIPAHLVAGGSGSYIVIPA